MRVPRAAPHQAMQQAETEQSTTDSGEAERIKKKLQCLLCGCPWRVSCVFIGGEEPLQVAATLHPAATTRNRLAMRPQSITRRARATA
jgi:hypothetical protein